MTREECFEKFIKPACIRTWNEKKCREIFEILDQESSLYAKESSVFDKIRAEILKEKECAYADFDRYKVEFLGQDWEDVYDSIPQDDYRYGMERCVEIIDRYRGRQHEL